MWGSFWIAFGILNVLQMWDKLPAHPAGSVSDPQFAMWFYTLAAITLAGAFAALAESMALFGVLGTLAAGSAIFAVGLSLGSVSWVKVAGWVLVASAILAYYTASSMMMLSGAGKVILPLGKPKREANVPGGQPVKPIQLEWAEPGIKKGAVAISSVPGRPPPSSSRRRSRTDASCSSTSNAYEAAIRLADALGAEDVGGLLRANLEQEIAALDQLGAQADRLAQAAVEERTVEA
jgi:hypothetical protein